MNRLQKKAWTEMIAAIILIVLITIPYMLHLSKQSTPALSGFIIYIVIVGFILLIGHLNEVKNIKQFDEREHFIYEKSSSLSTYVFILYLLAFSFMSYRPRSYGSGCVDAGHGFNGLCSGPMYSVDCYSITVRTGR
ncbi:MAG: hypothetical protein ACYSO1_04875 [Planctomycetota bacterium]|jgi:hypothetical protein